MNDYVSLLSMKELYGLMKNTFRSRDYIVTEANAHAFLIQHNVLYRADYFGVILVKAGMSEYIVHDKTYQLVEGDMLFCAPYEAFKVVFVSDDYEATNIFFTADFISDAGFNYKSNDIFKSFSNNPSYIIHQQWSLFNRLSFHLARLAELNDPAVDIHYLNEMVWHHFSLVIYEIDSHFKASDKAPQTTSRQEELTTKFFVLVRDHFKEHHDVQFYADELFVSRKYLGRVIKQVMLKTPSDIISHVLLIEAKVLLKNSEATISQIAAQLNFTDQAVFSKFFKNQTGSSPSDYRRSDNF
jgi:AraC family transcriptional regulator, transcriptional activator of pobA